MPLTLTLTRRVVVVGIVTTAALGGALAVGSLLGGPGGSVPAANAATPGTAQPTDAFPGITVTGTGTVTGTPDVLTLDVSVHGTGGDASAALSDAAATMNRVRASLRGNGVAAADLGTSGLTLQADYRYDGDRQTVDGYSAIESLTAKLRDLHRAGHAISAASAAGGNAAAIDGVSFELEDNTALLASARTAAFADAKAKAGQYAAAAGRTLGPVTRITESVNTTEPVPGERAAAGAAGASVPVDPGTTQESVTVEVVFGLT
jgi:uncharacterized protein